MTGQYKSRYPVQHFGVPVDAHQRRRFARADLLFCHSSLNVADWDAATAAAAITTTTTAAGRPVVIPPADGSPEVDETFVDVVEESDRSKSPMSDGLIVDDGVAGHDHLVDNQRAFLGQRSQNASLGHGRDSDNPLRIGSAVETRWHDPVADLNFGGERSLQSGSETFHCNVGHHLVQQPLLFGAAVLSVQTVGAAHQFDVDVFQ